MFHLRLALIAIGVSLMFLSELSAQRKLATGVLKVIEPNIDPRDAHSLPMPTPGVEATPYETHFFPESETLHEMSRQVVFYRDVWQYEFAFLGLRQMTIEVPSTDGGPPQRQNVWYMVYRIRNTGKALGYERIDDDPSGQVRHQLIENPETLDPTTLPNRFFGDFTLEGWVYDDATRQYVARQYSERVIPSIVPIIQEEEDPDQPLFDKIQIIQREIAKVPEDAVGGGIWGVATWLNVDPKLDFISVKVTGLTNAYRVRYNPSGEKEMTYKTLRLNFWRPGDRFQEARDPVVYGIPLVDSTDEQKDLALRYRMPGPMIRCDQLIEATQRSVLLFEVDAGITPRKLDSQIAAELDGGQLPAGLELAFHNAGVTLGMDYQLSQRAPGTHWRVNDTSEDGEPRVFLLELAPIFWDKKPGGGLRFMKRLDHFWFYE